VTVFTRPGQYTRAVPELCVNVRLGHGPRHPDGHNAAAEPIDPAQPAVVVTETWGGFGASARHRWSYDPARTDFGGWKCDGPVYA
jgi:hypothetical protein